MQPEHTHTEGTFSANGLNLFTQSWQPAGNAKALVVIVHGLGEHSGRYTHVAEALVQHSYTVTALDLRGHGRSDADGGRCFVRSFNEYLDDVAAFIAAQRHNAPQGHLFVLGHSMGGLILTLLASEGRLDGVNGLILSGAGLKVNAEIPRWLLAISKVTSALIPRVPAARVDTKVISRDPAVVARYESDPLVFHGGVPMRTGKELLDAGARARTRLDQVRLPLLIMHGTEDRLIDPQGSRDLYAQAGASDKTLHLYEGYFHEILNEPQKERVLQDVLVWLDQRVEG